MIVTHLHHDHFSAIGSFKNTNDKPKMLKFLEEKVNEAKEEGDDKKVDDIQKFLDFSGEYTEDVDEAPDWGFDFFNRYQLPYRRAEKANAGRENIINNRSFIVGVEYAGKKIMIPGDMKVEGWEKALSDKKCQDVLSDTNFFTASHHGHKSGFTEAILDHSGKPEIFVISAKSGDRHIDSSYGNSDNSKGYLYGWRHHEIAQRFA